MKAVQFSEYGEPDVLHVADVDEPHAAPGEIRIAVRASGLNALDLKLRSGILREVMPVDLPSIPGFDVAGVVDEVGDGVSDVAVGDEVFGFPIGGGAAEHAVLEHYARKPDDLSWAEAGALPVAAETSMRALNVLALEPGQTILVNGASGGVGAVAVQLARARGARVIGTASAGNQEYVRGLGADPTTYGDGLVDRVRELAPGGVDRALDIAGSGLLADLIEITGTPEHVVTIADGGAAEHGVKFTSGREGRAWGALDQAAQLHGDGQLTIAIGQTFPFEQAPEAHRVGEGRRVRGKLVLTPK